MDIAWDQGGQLGSQALLGVMMRHFIATVGHKLDDVSVASAMIFGGITLPKNNVDSVALLQEYLANKDPGIWSCLKFRDDKNPQNA